MNKKMKKTAQFRAFIKSMKGKAFRLDDVNIAGRARLALSLVRMGELVVLNSRTTESGRQKDRLLIATVKLRDTVAKPPKPVPMRESSVYSKLVKVLDTLSCDTEISYPDFKHVAGSETAIRSGLRTMLQRGLIHVKRQAHIGKGMRINIYHKGPSPEDVISARGAFTNCDLSGWASVTPWLFAPTNLPSGRLTRHEMERDLL